MTLSRRSFLVRGGSAALVAATGAGTAVELGTSRAGATAAESFHGMVQPGILSAPQRAHHVVSLDVMADSKGDLTDFFHVLTNQVREMIQGGVATEAFNAGVAPDNGMLGPVIPSGQLTATVSVGASLFDERFGLAPKKPAHLTAMRSFPNDNLDAAQCHGDVSIQFQAADSDTVLHALRRIMQATDGIVAPRWRVNAFTNPPRPSGPPRNHFGFNDGVANPDTADAAQMEALVWAARDGSEPAWTAGGSYEVIRVIRQLVEFWDRVSVEEQELMIGRRRDTGAPLGTNSIDAIPDYADDRLGNVMPLNAHMRMANPRTPATADSRILRRAINYDRGLDVNGNLDVGLVFICYQQNVKRQFEAVQTRLIDEPMVDYISPIGGGYFFTLPGVRDASDWYASSLLS